jgi:nitrate reductase NapAB chaperone NapD
MLQCKNLTGYTSGTLSQMRKCEINEGDGKGKRIYVIEVGVFDSLE